MDRVILKNTRSVCAFDCPDSCGIGTDGEGRLIGRSDNPYTRGFVCGKLRRMWSHVVADDRLKTPLLKDGHRYRPVSWDEAIGIIASGADAAIRKGGHRSILWFTGAGNIMLGNALLDRFAGHLGGCSRVRGSLCGGEGIAAINASSPKRRCANPLHTKGNVLLWGRNVSVTNPHFVPILKEAAQKGSALGCIDVRHTPTAKIAHKNWTIRPGCDLALALWLHGQCGSPHVKNCPDTGETARTSGLSPDELYALLGFIKTGPAVWAGWAIQRSRAGYETMRAIDALAHHIGGAGVNFSFDESIPFPAPAVPGESPVWYPRPAPGAALINAQPPINMAIFSRSNPATQVQDSSAMKQFIRGCPFTVCIDWQPSATAQMCDLILPCATFLECGGDMCASYWHPLVQEVHPLIRTDYPTEAQILERVLAAMETRIFVPIRPLYKPAMDEVKSHLIPAGEGMWCLAPQEVPQYGFAPLLPECGAGGPEENTYRLITPHAMDYVNGNTLVPISPVCKMNPYDMKVLIIEEGNTVKLAPCEPGGHGMTARAYSDGSMKSGTLCVNCGTPGLNGLIPPGLTALGNSCISDVWVKVTRSE